MLDKGNDDTVRVALACCFSGTKNKQTYRILSAVWMAPSVDGGASDTVEDSCDDDNGRRHVGTTGTNELVNESSNAATITLMVTSVVHTILFI